MERGRVKWFFRFLSGVTDVGARLLAESPHLPRLKYLSLIGSRLRPDTWYVLQQRFGWDGC